MLCSTVGPSLDAVRWLMYNRKTLPTPCPSNIAMILQGISRGTGKSLGLQLPMSMREWRTLL